MHSQIGVCSKWNNNLYTIMPYLNDCHLKIRCASSIAKRPIFPSLSSFANSGWGWPVTSKNFSGVTNTTSVFPQATSFWIVASFWLLPRKVEWIPLAWRLADWSCMRLMVGVSTTVIFPVYTAGKLKQRLFPDPVGWTTKVFSPFWVAWMILSCQCLKAGRPKRFTRMPVSWASSLAAMETWIT